jgi:two-component system, NtrC family, response regulator GlrR
VVDGPDRGLQSIVKESPSLIGACPSSILRLSDDSVSRYHLELDVFAEGLRVRDLRSTNGTYRADGTRVDHAFLEPGEDVKIGLNTLRMHVTDDPALPRYEKDTGSVASQAEDLGIVARSKALRELLLLLSQLVDTTSSMAFIGPRGVGRRTIAEFCHRQGPFAAEPIYFAEASQISSGSELLSASDYDGAPNLSVLVANVQDLSPSAQVFLKNLIERGEVPNYSGANSGRIHVRMFCTSTQPIETLDLTSELKRHLGALRFRVPAMSNRSADIIPLAKHFLSTRGLTQVRLGKRVQRLLESRPWEGQVAELFDILTLLLVSPADDKTDVVKSGFLQKLRRCLLLDLLEMYRGDVGQVARCLGIRSSEAFQLIASYDIDLDFIE